MTRTVVVGDVHGCLGELRALLDKCDAEPGRDDIVFVGDLVAKGPDSRGVVELARKLRARTVRGNHDQKVISWWEAREEGQTPPKLKPAHQDVCDELADADWAYLVATPHFVPLDAHQAIVVHAGLVPGVALKDQDPENMITMRSIRPDGTPTKVLEDGVPWASLWRGPEHVVFGHDAVRGLQEYTYATGLDTGCVYGGELTALIFPERKLVRVRAERVWADKEGGS